jgi:two-component system cell cycle response regulator
MPGDKKKILIVEDDKFLSKMLSRMLDESNYEIVMASSGTEGLAKSAEAGVNMILLDIMLPDMAGFDVLEKVKANSATANIPVIIMSNLAQPEDIQQGKKLGAVDYLVKSDLSLDEIVAKVNSHL